MGFTKFKAYKKLAKLAKKPIDLTKDKVMSPDRINQMTASCLSLKMFYATERVNKEVIDELIALAEESGAVAQMQEMQNGKVINAIKGYDSENRMVLHTAMRDFFANQNTSQEAKEAAHLAKMEIDKLERFVKEIDEGGIIKHVVQVGIGGSDLGPRAIYYSLKAFEHGKRKVHFLSNVDPDDAADRGGG